MGNSWVLPTPPWLGTNHWTKRSYGDGRKLFGYVLKNIGYLQTALYHHQNFSRSQWFVYSLSLQKKKIIFMGTGGGPHPRSSTLGLLYSLFGILLLNLSLQNCTLCTSTSTHKMRWKSYCVHELVIIGVRVKLVVERTPSLIYENLM